MEIKIRNTIIVNDVIRKIYNENKILSTKTVEEIDLTNENLNNIATETNKDITKRLKNNYINRNKSNLISIPIQVISNKTLIFFKKSLPIVVNVENIPNVIIKSKVKPYGINNTLIEIKLEVEIKSKIYYLMKSIDIKQAKEYPILIKIKEGKIPNYYDVGK